MQVHARSRCGFGTRIGPLRPVSSSPTIAAPLVRARFVRDPLGRAARHPPANAGCPDLTFEQDASV